MGNGEDMESKYKLLCSTMMDAFAAVDMTGRYQEANQPFLDLVGYTKEELLTLSLFDLTPEKWRPLEHKILDEQVLVRGCSDVFRKEFRRKDGVIVPVELRIVLVKGSTGKPIGMWAIVRDITQHIQGEKNLQRFEHSVESSPDAVYWISSEGGFPYVNAQACRALGYTREELQQLHIWDIDIHFSQEQWKPHWEKVSDAGGAHIERMHRRKDGTVFPVEISSTHIFLNRKEFHVAYARDISQRKKTDKDLRFFKHAIDTSLEGVFQMDQGGGFTYVNDQACRSLAYTREELQRLHIWDIDPSFTPERWMAHWNAMRTAKVRLIETHHRRKDGSTFPIEVMAYRLPFGDKERHLAFVSDITERRRAADALKKSEERYRLLFDSNPQPMWLVEFDTQAIIAVNQAAIEKYGYSQSHFLTMRLSDIQQARGRDAAMAAAHFASQGNGGRVSIQRHRLRSGELIDVELHTRVLNFEGRRTTIILINDITARLKAEEARAKLEAQLLQAQKLESVGRLAGGVAHDYNNMLSVILGCAELMQKKIAPGDPLLKELAQIKQAAMRSKNITQQLLAFSRKQVFEPKIIDTNALIRSVEENLLRLIGEDIELLFIPSADRMEIEFDPTQFEQILMNLAVNARDAMPDGGKLTIETNRVVLDHAYCRDHVGFEPGDFVRISVSDNGLGMPSETLDQIFEPFFTTKEVGRGTGLGLATVYGIVKQGGGFINVYSETDIGTTFRIYIPRAKGEAETVAVPEASRLEKGTETILLVEDDEMVRFVTKALLEQLGYTVIAAVGPEEALAIFGEKHSSIDLLVTDVVMPRMNGKELHDKLTSVRADLKSLFMSGYTTNVIVHHGVLDRNVFFIAKPFTIESLARKVREALYAGSNTH